MSEEIIGAAKNTVLWLGVIGGLFTVGRGIYALLTHLIRPFNLDIAVPGRIYFIFDSADSIPRLQLEYKLTNYNQYPVIFDRTRISLKRKEKEDIVYEWSKFYRESNEHGGVIDDGQAFPVSIKSMDSTDIRLEYDLVDQHKENWFWEDDIEEESIELELRIENMRRRFKKTLCRKSLYFRIDFMDGVKACLNDGNRHLSSFRIEKKTNFHNQALETIGTSSAGPDRLS